MTSRGAATRGRAARARRAGWLAAAALAAALAAPASGRGAPSAAPPAQVDWERGLVIARAAGTADRRAPSPTVARVGALREAEQRAAAALLEAARALPGDGDTVGALVDRSPAAAARLAAAIAAAVEVRTDALPDGSVRIARGLPLEALRQAIAGPRRVGVDWAAAVGRGGPAPVPTPGVAAPTALVVDARGLALRPRVGLRLRSSGVDEAPPVRWLGAPPPEGDPWLGASPLRLEAEAVDGGAVRLPGGDAVGAALAAGVPAVVVIRPRP